ncbi:hypothetical protein HBB16_11455 [Pseudonocardia sp. MCCB 268]|nr:hypothetical protein [Pseudonocardia cytotoxica]
MPTSRRWIRRYSRAVPQCGEHGVLQRCGLGDLRAAPPPPPAEVARAAARVPAGVLRYNYTADEIDDCAAMRRPSTQRWASGRARCNDAGIAQLAAMPPVPELFDDGTGVPVVDIWASLPKRLRRGRARAGDGTRYAGLVLHGTRPRCLLRNG